MRMTSGSSSEPSTRSRRSISMPLSESRNNLRSKIFESHRRLSRFDATRRTLIISFCAAAAARAAAPRDRSSGKIAGSEPLPGMGAET